MAVERIDSDRLFEPKIAKEFLKELDKIVNKGDEASASLIKIRDVLREIDEIKNAEQFKLFTAETAKLNKVQAELIKLEEKRLKLQEKIIKEAVKQNKANKEFTKNQKDKIKLSKLLSDANANEAHDVAELKVQLQEQNKANKELVNENAKIVGAYKAQRTTLAKLTKEYKNLIIQEGGASDKSEKLKKDIEKLSREIKDVDKEVRDLGKDVNDTADDMDDASSSTLDWIKGLGAAAIAVELLSRTIANNEVASEALQVKQAQAESVVSVLTNSLFEAAKGAGTLFSVLLGFQRGSTTTQKDIAKIAESVDDLGGKLETAKRLSGEAELANIALGKRSRGLSEEVARLSGRIEEQNLIAGDSTRSFDEISKAARRATVIEIERATILRGIAKEEFEIIEKRIEALGAGANTAALANELSEKRIELIELQNELDLVTLDNQKVLRETTRDRFEQELDFAIDFFDNTKTLLERQISDEDEAFSVRANNLKRLEILAESSFQSQIDLINAQVGQDINIRELVKLDDERLVRQKLITDFTVTDEITLVRILEVLRERKTVEQDILETNKELTTSLEDQLKASDELFNEINQTRRQGIIDETKDREDNRQLRETDLKLQAIFETDLAQDSADQRILIAEKLKNDLAAIERERVADVEAANKKIAEDDERLKQERIDNAVEFANSVFDALGRQLERQNDLFNEALNNEIQSLQESIDRQIESNRVGGEQKLADDQAILTKRELERKRALEAQAKQERLIALSQQFVNAAAAHAKEDPEGAVIKALAEVFAAEGIAKLIAGFAEGGYTGDGGKYEVAGAVHKGENVNTAKQVVQYGMRGWSAKDFDKKISEGYFNQFATNNINIPEHLFKNIDLGGMTPSAFDSSSINKGQKDAANHIVSTIKGEAIDYEIFLDGVARVVTKLTKGGSTEKVIYERDSDTY